MAKHVFLLGPSHDAGGTEEQAIGRIHRVGQRETCHVYRILASSTAEVGVQENSTWKRFGPHVNPAGVLLSRVKQHTSGDALGRGEGTAGKRDAQCMAPCS
jgi:hypothetical protein